MDGIELLDSIKMMYATSHIPVVILTARADIASRIEGLKKEQTHTLPNRSTRRNFNAAKETY
jgi:CheY-like chemotaxis protein